MRITFWILIFSLSLLIDANDSFITNMEYAKMLYKNPRGIGCNKCHGIFGQGMIIAKYKEKGKIKYLKAPDIKDLSKEEFFKTFNAKHQIMPKYFLTFKEINTLYSYLQSYKRIQKKRGKQ